MLFIGMLFYFRFDLEKWGVNVQVYFGFLVNFVVYIGFLNFYDRIMGFDLFDGGYLIYGFMIEKKRIFVIFIYFELMLYKINLVIGLIDYEMFVQIVRLFRFKLIVVGISVYSRYLDYVKFREVCNEVGVYFMVDMVYISGFVVGDVVLGLFEYVDIVIIIIYKLFRGLRFGVIFYRKGIKGYKKNGDFIKYDYGFKIDFVLFFGFQGGSYNN